MNSWQWHSDEHGTYNLKASRPALHVYIQPRRPYCDRGHWQLNWIGLPQPDSHVASLYFHRLESAITEAERWVHRGLTGQAAVPACPDIETALAQRSTSLPWHRTAQGWEIQINGLTMTLEEQATAAGPLWRWDASLKGPHGLEGLDDSDAFPRYFLDPAVALDEAECFRQWRLEQAPIEHPQAIALPPRAVKLGHAPEASARRAPRNLR